MEVWVIYKHCIDPVLGVVFRFGGILGWRKSVYDYYNRLDTAAFLVDRQLRPYYHHTVDRRHPTLDDCNPLGLSGRVEPENLVARIPFHDKLAGFMGAPCSATLDFLDKYHLHTNLMAIAQLATVFSWVTSPVNFLHVIREWTTKGLPPESRGHHGNLTVAMLWDCLDKYGGLNTCKWQRLTFNVTCSFTFRQIISANKVVYELLVTILGTLSIGGELPSFQEATKRLVSVHQSGALQGQHVLYFLTGLGKVPAMYGANAVVCPGTEAAKRSTLAIASLNKVLHDFAVEIDETPMFVEEMHCEATVRDGDPSTEFDSDVCDARVLVRKTNKDLKFPFRPDVFMPGQRNLVLTKLPDGMLKLVHEKRVFNSAGGGFDDTRVVVTPRPLSEYSDPPSRMPWSDPALNPILDMEVKISKKSSLRTATKLEGQDGKRVRKRTTPHRLLVTEEDDYEGEVYRSSIPKALKYRSQATVRSTRGQRFTVQSILGANFQDGNFSFLEPRTIAYQCASATFTKNGKLSNPPRAALVRKSVEVSSVDHCGLATFTCAINNVSPPKSEPSLWKRGLIDVPTESKAHYLTPDHAEFATMLYCMCVHPYTTEPPSTTNRNGGGQVPLWVDKKLPMSREGAGIRSLCVLHVSGRDRSVQSSLFGVLTFEGSDRVLSVFQDGELSEWEDIRFSSIAKAHAS